MSKKTDKIIKLLKSSNEARNTKRDTAQPLPSARKAVRKTLGQIEDECRKAAFKKAHKESEDLRYLLAAVLMKAGVLPASSGDTEQAAQEYINAVSAPARTGDQIVYKALDYSPDGARCIRAGWSILEAAHIGARDVVPVVIHVQTARAQALAKLDGVDRLVLGL